MNRRNFIIQSTSLLSASLLIGKGLYPASFANYKMGLQLFSIRDPLAKDLTGTIKKIASAGYEDCETYGYDPIQVKYYGVKAAEFKKLLADNGMITTSGHYDFT